MVTIWRVGDQMEALANSDLALIAYNQLGTLLYCSSSSRPRWVSYISMQQSIYTLGNLMRREKSLQPVMQFAPTIPVLSIMLGQDSVAEKVQEGS